MNGKLSLMTLKETNMNYKTTQILRGAQTISNMKRNLHSPLDIENILRAHYDPYFSDRSRWSESHTASIEKLLNEHLLVRYQNYGETHETISLSEKGKVFLDMILNTPLPVQGNCWVDPRD